MRIRASWLIVFAVVAVSLVRADLRQQMPIMLTRHKVAVDTSPTLTSEEPALRIPLLTYNELHPLAAEAFVERTAPEDPELLFAVALLRESGNGRTEALRRAAEAGRLAPAWAAYSMSLIQALPPYASIAEYGADPANAVSMAETAKLLQQEKPGQPDRLRPEEVAPAREAIRSWQDADPENGLPLAVETKLLHAVGRPQEALARWRAAARRPSVHIYEGEETGAVTRLLMRMGMPEFEAIQAAALRFFPLVPAYASLRAAARVAQYEGGLARLEGRDADAMAWWQSTCDIGRAVQERSDAYIGYLVGVAIEGIGASPTWRWYPNSRTRAAGPLSGGAVFYGRYHDFWVARAGSAADRELRDRVVQSKARLGKMRGLDLASIEEQARALEWIRPLGFACAGFVVGVVLLACYLIFGSWRRQEAEAASNLTARAAVALAAVALVPAAVGLLYAGSVVDFLDRGAGRAWQAVTVGAVLTVAAALLLPLLAASSSREGDRKGLATWRGNLRRVLPGLVATSAVFFLLCHLTASSQRHAWVSYWRSEGHSEMATIRRTLGTAWDHPAIPAVAWRAEYPPNVKRN